MIIPHYYEIQVLIASVEHVQQPKEFLGIDVPVLRELTLGCPQLSPDISHIKEEMQKLEASFQVFGGDAIQGRKKASLLFLFISFFLSRRRRSYVCDVILQNLYYCLLTFVILEVKRKNNLKGSCFVFKL